MTTQRLRVNQNRVTGNSGRRQAWAFNLSENGHAREVTRIMKVRSDNKEDGDANEDDDKLFPNAGQTDETVAMLTVPSPSGLRILLT